MGTKVVNVRALPRAGFMAFFRGGHRWPSDAAGRTVRVTDELFSVLKAETYLAVGMPDEGVEPEEGVLEYIDNRFDDRAHNASAGAREDVARLKAEKAALEALAQRDALAEEVKRLRAELAAKPEAMKPPPAKLESKKGDGK